MRITRRAAILSGVCAPAAWNQNATPALKHPDVPFVPTPPEVIEAMLDLAGVQASDLVYDLGCGDGRILVAAARKFGAKGYGVDIDGDLIADAKERAQAAGVSAKVRFVQADLFQTDLRPATVVALFLIPAVLEKLKSKLRAELRPGSRIVSYLFDMPDWKPSKVGRVDGRPIYLWTIPGEPK